jgi:hypothetical protein
MSPQVKAALIIAGAIIITMAMWIYFSSYQTCVRARDALGNGSAALARIVCARETGGGR